MSVFRFGVSVFANLIMTVIGGFLLYLGGVGLFLTLQVYLFLETEIPGGEGTVNEVLGAANGGPLNLFADATPWLIMVGQLLIGLPMLVFGVLGFVRRLQTGLPDEDAGVPETSAGRIGSTLVFLIGGLIGLKLMFFAMLDVADQLQIEVNHERAEAVIEKTWKSAGTEDEERGAYYSIYRFRTHAGEDVKSKVRVPNLAGKHFVAGNRVLVSYLPSDPDTNVWEGRRALSDFILPLFFYAVLVVGGFWGVKRNLFDAPADALATGHR